jgi:hypothetical protein
MAEGLQTAMLAVNIPSVVLASSLIVTYAVFKRHQPHLSVLCFSTCAALLSLALLIGPAWGYEALAAPNSTVCQVQGFLIQLFGFSAIGYYLSISVTLFLIVELEDLRLERKPVVAALWLSHLSPIVALVTALVCLLRGQIGYRAPLWCWIAGDPPLLEMAFFYGPMFVFAVIAALAWVRVMFRLRRSADSFSALFRHVVFCAVFCVLFGVMFAHRLYNVLSGKDYYTLEMLHLIALGGVGLWIFLIFFPSKYEEIN